MWKHLKSELPERVGEPINVGVLDKLTLSPEFTLELNPRITQEDVEFYDKNSRETESSSFMHLNSKLAIDSRGLISKLRKDGKLIGFILTVPYHFLVEGASFSPVVVCATVLAVDKTERSKQYAGFVIQDIMRQVALMFGYCSAMWFGSKPRTPTSRKLQTWYRVLDITAALHAKYDVSLPSGESVAYLEVSKKHKWRPSVYDDFKGLIKRKVQINFSEEDFDVLSKGSITWITLDKVFLFGFSDYLLQNSEGVETYACLLVYCEWLSSPDSNAFDTMFYFLKSHGYTVVHGIKLGACVYDDMLLSPLKANVATDHYIDFYNIHVGDDLRETDINVLYM